MLLTQKYFDVLTKFADQLDIDMRKYDDKRNGKLAAEYAILPLDKQHEISREIKTFRDVLCAMIDEELYFTPRWHNQVLKIAKEEGLLEPVPEPD